MTATSTNSFQSPPTSSTNVATTTSSAGRLINLIKNAAGALLPSIVLRSPSPSTASCRTTSKTDRQPADEPQTRNRSQYVSIYYIQWSQWCETLAFHFLFWTIVLESFRCCITFTTANIILAVTDATECNYLCPCFCVGKIVRKFYRNLWRSADKVESVTFCDWLHSRFLKWKCWYFKNLVWKCSL